MTLYLIGLGASPLEDISVRGLKCVKKAKSVYIETYTCPMQATIAEMESCFGKTIKELSRGELEETNKLIGEAKRQDTALLVVGDPLFATTHIELIMRAEKAGVKCEVIHNASVLDYVLDTGLQGYKFGRIVSLPHPTPELVESPYRYILENKRIGLHTLLLLDVAREQQGIMTIPKAIEILFEMENRFKGGVIKEEEKWVGCSGLGTKNKIIKFARPEKLKNLDFKHPPYCIVIPGRLHFIEEEALNRFA
ncbi:diphthine synthase [Candidatus Woesearchaeota archaeon]|nr:MAG: diphthine synthase [Candidatus Woesearchaeota archaeon]